MCLRPLTEIIIGDDWRKGRPVASGIRYFLGFLHVSFPVSKLSASSELFQHRNWQPAQTSKRVFLVPCFLLCIFLTFHVSRNGTLFLFADVVKKVHNAHPFTLRTTIDIWRASWPVIFLGDKSSMHQCKVNLSIGKLKASGLAILVVPKHRDLGLLYLYQCGRYTTGSV